MVIYFVNKFNPEKESMEEFYRKRYPHHYAFLKKRGWSDEDIDQLRDE